MLLASQELEIGPGRELVTLWVGPRWYQFYREAESHAFLPYTGRSHHCHPGSVFFIHLPFPLPTQRQLFFRKKLLHSSQMLRAVSLGQDRYRHRYWVLPYLTGIFVEGTEGSLGRCVVGPWFESQLTKVKEFLFLYLASWAFDCMTVSLAYYG